VYAPLLALGLAAATPAPELPASRDALATEPHALVPELPSHTRLADRSTRAPEPGATATATSSARSSSPAGDLTGPTTASKTTAPSPATDSPAPAAPPASPESTSPPAPSPPDVAPPPASPEAAPASSDVAPSPASPDPTPTPAASAPAPAPARPPSTAPAPTPARPRWWGPDPRPKVSGYGGPALRLSGLHGAFAAFVGLEGGINILQRLTVGASLQWLLNPVDAGAYARGGATRININYGGLVVDVAYVRGKRVAGTLGGLLGGGGGCVQDPENGRCADKTAFFVGEPRAGLRVVLAPIVRLHLAVGYRLVAARTWTGPQNLGGPMGMVMLEFGWF
jgi:hypothetical protein